MLTMLNRIRHEGILAWLWSLLPDRCEVKNMNTYWVCCRKGMRGNENRLRWPDGKVRVTCDYCTSEFNKKFPGWDSFCG